MTPLTFWDTLFRLMAAFALGSIIGYERERSGKHPGLRTQIIICLGSTLIMLVSIKMFDDYKGMASVDPGRIAAGIVTGIGFLGAGTIIRSNEGIKGLTTAGSVWLNSAIGMACGCGYFDAAVAATFIGLFTLTVLRRLERD
jgi:putative Mg2+ transporter-C (MgtC) family protein